MQTVLWDEKFSGKVEKGSFEDFKRRAEAVSSEVYITNLKDTKKIFQEIFKRENVKNIIAFKSDLIDRLEIDKITKDMNINLYFEGGKKEAGIADVGISEMECALAETGSVIEWSYPVWKRLVSAMPNVHIALVKSDRIVKDFESLFEIFGEKFESGHISFITGPSRTADIERVLTIGVHGPSKLVVIFVEEEK
ncbi:L-lactate dehydrogenase complex protein LldG [Thermodesulfobium acidiphilum]|uniref:L-lactate dehydrogenase complex protein LldG n=1 Tax=Thermodesulfobium acidiphilum TaxID=1794699 RepID=A0A2R4W092_THEAF|nr:LUD domain-containing protein [Thermodesulfobium acidiphilum]AWB10146.1 L-lactate dehydrogenase complex protein LldG [Thermodesulfobium acidiphilum]